MKGHGGASWFICITTAMPQQTTNKTTSGARADGYILLLDYCVMMGELFFVKFNCRVEHTTAIEYVVENTPSDLLCRLFSSFVCLKKIGDNPTRSTKMSLVSRLRSRVE
jgi:hypothetical protein